MLKRSGFQRRAHRGSAPQDREARLAERAARASANVRPRASVVAVIPAAPAAAVVKESVVRSVAYRKAVAGLPCASCGVVGWSQHAHENGPGKGKGLKVCDTRAMPLCCTRPGVEGCHVAFDGYRLLPGGREAHREAGARWSAETRALVLALGLWPKTVPKPSVALAG